MALGGTCAATRRPNDSPDLRSTDSLVYGPTPGPSLRLITCTGWDSDEREYRDNVVVYATTHTKHSPT
ncbi:hypothetical protein [Streptomyces sp. NBC_00727]|uniref:hypothetical protein n=1 Tax=Streptomyces sp. NBC_00727 TaxID=2903675 RepID=UPI00386A9BCD